MVVSPQISRVYPLGSRVNEAGRLEVGGCDTIELALEFGTPAYVVAEDDIRARAKEFLEALRTHHGDDFDVLFGSKAFPCTAVDRVVAEEGLGCDVASAGELHLALRAGFDPARIYLHGNAKGDDELSYARRERVGHIVIDAFDEVERLERIVDADNEDPQAVLVRVRPGIKPSTHDFISTGQLDSKFGLPLAEAPAAIERARGSSARDLIGLHMHIGSQIFELESFRQAIAALAPLGEFPVYNLGGGLGVAYTS